MPVTSWSPNAVIAALPKAYAQLAVLRGTGCSNVSRTGAASCRRWSNHSAYTDHSFWVPRLAGKTTSKEE
jgi:hypothetical protein